MSKLHLLRRDRPRLAKSNLTAQAGNLLARERRRPLGREGGAGSVVGSRDAGNCISEPILQAAVPLLGGAEHPPVLLMAVLRRVRPFICLLLWGGSEESEFLFSVCSGDS